jgi:hypothetical protein
MNLGQHLEYLRANTTQPDDYFTAESNGHRIMDDNFTLLEGDF